MHYPVADVEVNFFVTLLAGFLIGTAFSTLSVSGAAFTSFFQMLIGVATAMQPINVLATSLTSTVGLRTYLREGRVALPIAAFLLIGVALGVLLGARAALLAFGSSFSSSYLGFMGGIAVITGSYIIAHTMSRAWRRESALLRMVSRFESRVHELRRSGEWESLARDTYATIHITPRSFLFSFAGEKVALNPLSLVIWGTGIGFISALMGIGGGNLFLFLLASVYRLPLYLVVGTTLMAVLFTSLWSCINYLHLGMAVDWMLFLNLALGLAVGALIAPRYSKFIPEIWLRRLAGTALIFAGIFMLYRSLS